MVDWLESIDRKLSALREREAVLRYETDVSGALNAAGLDDVAQERRELLLSEEAHSRAIRLRRETDDPETRRTSDLLIQQITLAQIDDEPELFRTRNELEQEFYAYHSHVENKEISRSVYSPEAHVRRAAHERMRPYLEATEPQSRRLLKLANAAARNAGFPTYVDAKLSCQDIDLQAFVGMLQHAGQSWRPIWHAFLASGKQFFLSDVQVPDICYLFRQHTASIAQDGMPSNVNETVAQTLALFGLDLAHLPIRIEHGNIPHCGAVHTLKVREDIRIVVRDRQVNSMLFHELGHALYYTYAPTDTVLLLDGRIGREGLAELWACLMETPEWLTRFSTFSPANAEAFLSARKARGIYDAHTYLRETLFELELYKDPDVDFVNVWKAVTKECLGLEDDTGVYSEFVFLYPMDIKDYVYARLIADALTADLRRVFGPNLLSANAMAHIVKNYYGDWNLAPWHGRLLPSEGTWGR
ncbi:MAG: hypothetical protein NTU83_08520 [Candidatus Hydrogenedentes bacterium]|nr:hypothetical protein [Candidatus Hydrogenedentota bacterium]